MSDQPVVPGVDSPKAEQAAPGGAQRSKEEIALDLMKFIATTTGYGRNVAAAGFSGKTPARTPEEHAESLLQLYGRCRSLLDR
jgi:hypothetical protein